MPTATDHLPPLSNSLLRDDKQTDRLTDKQTDRQTDRQKKWRGRVGVKDPNDIKL